METELDLCWRSEDSGDDSTEDDVQDVLVRQPSLTFSQWFQHNFLLYYFLDDSRKEWATSGVNRYNLVIINDRLMSEAVQTEHSYFNHDMDDDDSSHDANDIRSSSFKGKLKKLLLVYFSTNNSPVPSYFLSENYPSSNYESQQSQQHFKVGVFAEKGTLSGKCREYGMTRMKHLITPAVCLPAFLPGIHTFLTSIVCSMYVE